MPRRALIAFAAVQAVGVALRLLTLIAVLETHVAERAAPVWRRCESAPVCLEAGFEAPVRLGRVFNIPLFGDV